MTCIALAIDGKQCRAESERGYELCAHHRKKEENARLERKRRIERGETGAAPVRLTP